MMNQSIERVSCPYEYDADRFRLNRGTNQFEQQQYYGLYRARLTAFTKRLEKRAKQVCGEDSVIRTLADLKDGEKCIVMGTVVKKQALRPSVVKALAQEVNELPQPLNGDFKYISEDDCLFLEDDRQIVSLVGDIECDQLVTGVVVALYGYEVSGDVFHVEKRILPPAGPQTPMPPLDDDRFLLFLSGLCLSGREGDDGSTLLAGSLLADYLTGAVGSAEEHRTVTSKICRLVIAGNSIAESAQDRQFSEQARYLTRKHVSPSVESIKNLDAFLAKITPLLPVDLMPGDNDPTNHMWPQKPLHKCMFPHAYEHGELNSVTNPYQASVAGRLLLGTSGQNVTDAYRCCTEEEPIELLKYIYTWQHLCPSAPDTLDCQPFKDQDPFLISPTEQSPCPHIIFAGNQRKFASEIVEGSGGQKTLLLSVPSFKDTASAVLVNLRTLKTDVLDCLVSTEWPDFQ